ncbi:MAG: AMP-dependent synthetase/ligase [Myxococcaceae bacterium]
MRAEAQVSATHGKAQNLLELLLQRADKPDNVAARYKKNGAWTEMKWGQLIKEVRKVSAGLIAAGLRPGERVAIFAGTSLQWIICDLAVSAAQAVTIPIYSSNTPDEARYILQNSDASFLIIDNDEKDAKQPGRITRIRQKLSECPTVRKLIFFEGEPQSDKEMKLEELLAQGERQDAANPGAFEERVRSIKPDDLWGFIYTSGTTGDPKGVMLTHANWAYEATALSNVGIMLPDDMIFLFLPLAHSFAQVIKASWLGLGYQLAVDGAVDKVVQNLAEIRPTILPAVPRIFEKVYSSVVAKGSAEAGVKGSLFRWAFKLFDEYAEARNQGREYNSLGFQLAKRLVFSKVRASLDEKLGGRMRIFISGGAPLSRKIAYFFELVGFEVLEGFGLTETSAGATVSPPGRARIGTVGMAFPGTEIKIAADGEILIRGPGVMKGYYKNDAATAEVLEADGWFHSGDIGEIDADGYLRITDRKKDIIVTAGGKNVAPQNLENALKTFPIISQAMVHGDKRAYLTCLVTVSEEAGRKLLSDKGVTITDYAELSKRAEIREAVQAAVSSVNAEQPPYNTMKKFVILDRDFSQETGEMTPTLKVKRKVCTQKFKAELDSMYDEKAE